MISEPVAAETAFFDVDETLVNVKTMADFLPHYFRDRGFGPRTADTALSGLFDVARRHGRLAANTAYYRLFAGAPISQVQAIASHWFQLRSVERNFFNAHAVRAARQHVERGGEVVLVSGSFEPLLTPIAKYVGAAKVVCTRLCCIGDRYTGEVEVSMIGAAKADAVRAVIAMTEPKTRSWAYGDDITDSEMLSVVDVPVVVGSDRELRSLAAKLGWRILTDGATSALV